MNDPIVSVIVPNYNHSVFLERRIDSIIKQVYWNTEIILLDDASSDDSLAIIKKYAASDQRIIVVENEKNSGSPFEQWNRGISMAKGDYIWIAESDDIADPLFLKTLMKQFESCISCAIAYCQSFRLDDMNRTTGTWDDWTDELDPTLFKKDFVMNGIEYIERFLIYKNTIPNASAVVFKKEEYWGTGGVNLNVKNCSDWLCWLKILLNSDVSYIATPLNYFRYHKESVIAKANLKSTEKYEAEFDIAMRLEFKKYLKNCSNQIYKKIRKINHRYIYHSIGNYGLYNYKQGNRSRGIAQILRATIYPSFTLNYLKRLLISKSAKG